MNDYARAPNQPLLTTSSPTFAGLTINGAATFAATVTATGQFLAGAGGAAAPPYSFAGDPDSGFYPHADNIVGLSLGGTARYVFAATQIVPLTTGVIEIGAASNRFPRLYLGGNTPAASAPMIDCAQTWNDAGVHFIGVNISFVDTASGAGATPFRVRGGAAGTTDLFTVSKNGDVGVSGWFTAGTNVSCAASQYFVVGDRVLYGASASGVAVLSNYAANDFDRLCFGGTTNAFPAWKRVSSYFQARLADDSGFTAIAGTAFLDANTNQVVGTQGAAVADATGAGDVVAQLNTLLARLRAHGLIAT